jgi:hypothetical protein
MFNPRNKTDGIGARGNGTGNRIVPVANQHCQSPSLLPVDQLEELENGTVSITPMSASSAGMTNNPLDVSQAAN